MFCRNVLIMFQGNEQTSSTGPYCNFLFFTPSPRQIPMELNANEHLRLLLPAGSPGVSCPRHSESPRHKSYILVCFHSPKSHSIIIQAFPCPSENLSSWKVLSCNGWVLNVSSKFLDFMVPWLNIKVLLLHTNKFIVFSYFIYLK